jgi:hypothetical protein
MPTLQGDLEYRRPQQGADPVHANTIQTLYEHYTNTIRTLYEHYTNNTLTLFSPYTNNKLKYCSGTLSTGALSKAQTTLFMQALYSHYTNAIKTLFSHQTNNNLKTTGGLRVQVSSARHRPCSCKHDNGHASRGLKPSK